MNPDQIKVIGFDADDTLWINEQYFREAERAFCSLVQEYADEETAMKILFDIEMENLPLYGYGVKGFTLSMIEAANVILKDKIDLSFTDKMLKIGKSMLQKPVVLLDHVDAILAQLKPNYKLVLVTKGDLLDQERKLRKSGLEKHFHHIEVMSDKKEIDYQNLVKHLEIRPEEFVMIGNSLRSDILPVININSQAIYVPHEITWQHEDINVALDMQKKYHQVDRLADILEIIEG